MYLRTLLNWSTQCLLHQTLTVHQMRVPIFEVPVRCIIDCKKTKVVTPAKVAQYNVFIDAILTTCVNAKVHSFVVINRLVNLAGPCS